MNVHNKRASYIKRTYPVALDQWTRYRKIDDVLYDMCRKWPNHNDLALIQAKVTIIGRTYAAGLERRGSRDSRTGILDKVVNILHSNKNPIDAKLQQLRRIKRFSETANRQILSAHGTIVSILRRGTRSGTSFRSFVSKYLHFHAPIVPIFDSRASSMIRYWYPLRNPEFVPRILKKRDYDEVYFRFFRQFRLYYDDLRELGLKPTVRRADYHLVSSWYICP